MPQAISNADSSPVVIEPNAVYGKDAARRALGLTKHTLAREIRLGRLRVSKRGGKYFFLGEWLLEWLRAGEVLRGRVGESRPSA